MPRRRNASFAFNLMLLVVGMLALTYASAPLYRLFCQVTGYGGTTQQGIASDHWVNRDISVTFNADIDPNLPWTFAPSQRDIHVKIGQQVLTHYVAENTTDRPITGHATYNVLPFAAGPYFVKIECFCFKEQTLAPHERVDMPVLFYVDPAMLNDPETKDIKTITLSYTFFPVKK